MQLVLHFLSNPAPVLWRTDRAGAGAPGLLYSPCLVSIFISLHHFHLFISPSIPPSFSSFFPHLEPEDVTLISCLASFFPLNFHVGTSNLFFNSNHMALTDQRYFLLVPAKLRLPVANAIFSSWGGSQSIFWLGLKKQRCQFGLDWKNRYCIWLKSGKVIGISANGWIFRSN